MSSFGRPETRAFAELLIDCEEDRTLRAGARRHVARGRPLGYSLATLSRHRTASPRSSEIAAGQFDAGPWEGIQDAAKRALLGEIG
jgi:hypothetical protein